MFQPNMSFRCLPVLLFSVLIHYAGAAVDFSREVKPILAKHCYSCHGPEKQKASLRLDQKAAAFKGGEDHGAPIKPGNGKDSLIIHFVNGDDPDNLMPPKGERLSPVQIATLKTWIDEGAIWPDDGSSVSDPLKTHWSYQPVKVSGTHKSIDEFLAAKQQQAGLAFAEPADTRTLCRRVYFDVTGLPPTPEQIEAFVQAADGDRQSATNALVKTLLASPRYGERWARHWLDVVRFAETDGFETNRFRPNAWPYRDYVIEAFNKDKPYNRFIQEQLAGDALGADAATGFIVGGTTDIVKSPDPILTAQQRADELNDMVTATGTAFLGLTVNCARCHNHKFDPVTNEDYYGMVACFAGVKHGEHPIKVAETPEHAKKADALRKQLAQVEARLREFEPIASTSRTIIIPPNDAEHAHALIPASSKRTEYEKGTARGEAGFAGDADNLPTLGDGYFVWLKKQAKDQVFAWHPRAAGRFRVWVSWGSGYTSHDKNARYVLDADGDPLTTNDQTEIGRADHRKFADGTGKMPNRKLWSGFKDLGVHEFTTTTQMILSEGGDTGFPTADMVVLQEETGSSKATQPRLRLPVERGANTEHFAAVEARFVRFNIDATTQLEPCIDELEIFAAGGSPRNVALASLGAKATASSIFPNNSFHKLEHLNDGRYGNERSWISNERGRGWVAIEFPRTERIDRIVWSRDRDNVPRYNDRTPTAYRIEVSRDGKDWQTVATAQDRLPVGRKVSGPIFSTEGMPFAEAKRLTSVIAQRKSVSDALTALTTYPVVYGGKFVEPVETHKLFRGDVSAPREVVVPAVLSKIGPRLVMNGTTSDQSRRIALAKWITDPANPLTARVVVNRLWHYHFGTGIVDTPSDLGVNGSKPSHPELLDWLANELITHNWSLKHIQRLMLTSRAFQQSSDVINAKATGIDSSNRLLWHFPPHRLEAEPLRDTMLAVSGKLDLKMGGPGFELFEPNDNYVKVYTSKTEFGEPEFRRMIYQSKPRVQLDDVFGAFDCPDAGQVTPKRTVSTTPLQALSLLNSTFALQQAGFFAERLNKEAGADPKKQINRAFLLGFGREPSADEVADSQSLIAKHGLTVFCRALMNANEFIQIR
ncbi:MAG: Planctomycete cytochrome [Verrucomicrobiaceae bacterium]|nr:Planctomycete cytochrome [Verrucomicrobiaceae bacterium]